MHGSDMDKIAVESLTYIIATKSSGLVVSNLMFHGAKIQTVQDKMREEVLSELGNSEIEQIELSTIRNLEYCQLCLAETMRLDSPLREFSYKTLPSLKLGDIQLKAN